MSQTYYDYIEENLHAYEIAATKEFNKVIAAILNASVTIPLGPVKQHIALNFHSPGLSVTFNHGEQRIKQISQTINDLSRVNAKIQGLCGQVRAFLYLVKNEEMFGFERGDISDLLALPYEKFISDENPYITHDCDPVIGAHISTALRACQEIKETMELLKVKLGSVQEQYGKPNPPSA